MFLQGLPSEHIAIVGAIDPDAYASASPVATFSSAWIEVENWLGLMFVLQTGILGTSATIDAKLQEALTSGGGGAQDIAGKAITQLDEAGASPPASNDKQCIINLRPEEMDVKDGYKYARMLVTLDTANSDFSGLVLGINSRFGPASDFDAASVAEIVV